MTAEIKETLEDIKRHLDYVEITKQRSIRDNEIKVMYDYITNLQKENEKNQAIIKGIKKFIKKYFFRNLACNPEADYYTGWNSALKEIEKTIKMLEKNIGEEKNEE